MLNPFNQFILNLETYVAINSTSSQSIITNAQNLLANPAPTLADLSYNLSSLILFSFNKESLPTLLESIPPIKPYFLPQINSDLSDLPPTFIADITAYFNGLSPSADNPYFSNASCLLGSLADAQNPLPSALAVFAEYQGGPQNIINSIKATLTSFINGTPLNNLELLSSQFQALCQCYNVSNYLPNSAFGQSLNYFNNGCQENAPPTVAICNFFQNQTTATAQGILTEAGW